MIVRVLVRWTIEFELIAGLRMGGEVHMMEVRDVLLQLKCTDGVKGIVC